MNPFLNPYGAPVGGRYVWTSSHSLAELSGLKKELMRGGSVDVLVTCQASSNVVLDHYKSMWTQTRYVPSTGQTFMQMSASKAGPSEVLNYHGIDLDDVEDWNYIKSRRPNDKEKIDKLMEANELCNKSRQVEASDPRRKKFVERAVKTSKLCMKGHFMLFEMAASGVMSDENSENERKRVAKHIKDAIAAGRAFKELIGTDDFCKGNLFSFVPTRWYMRSLYAMGSFLLTIGDLDGADMYLKEYLANDIHDKLGARHKQLLAYIAREGGIHGEEVPFLLKARFCEDQMRDDVFALWNYTRALHSFAKKGKSKSSDKLLKHAIACNPYVPPLLLAWELSKEPVALMQLGSEGEAADYQADSMKHWVSVQGALEWLEKVYCEERKVPPPIKNQGDDARQLLSEGTRLVEKRDRESARVAVAKFDHLLEILNPADDGASSGQSLRSKVFQRKALCHKILEEYDIALRHFNSAMYLCDPRDTDAIKELFYNRADCKEEKGDLRGALEDYTFVYQRIGPFSTAIESIKHLEAKMRVQTSVFPPTPDWGVDVDEEEMRKTIRRISMAMPKFDPQQSVAAKLQRCSHCERGGVKLSKCKGCNEVLYCSRECQTSGWKQIHKYVCKDSKRRLDKGTKVQISGLRNAPQYNGKTATVMDFLGEKGRFHVEIPGDGDDQQETVQMSLKPQNLKKVEQDAA